MSDINEFNVDSGQFILRQYTINESSQREKELSYSPEESIVEVGLDEKTISILNKLKTLGLTELEAKAVIGL
jgi:hypothetical protein